MAPIFAQKCGFDNPRQHKAHGKRGLGITMLENSTVSEHVKMRSSRHSNLKTHKLDKRFTSENIDKKYEAMNPSLRNSVSPSPSKNSTSDDHPQPEDNENNKKHFHNSNQ